MQNQLVHHFTTASETGRRVWMCEERGKRESRCGSEIFSIWFSKQFPTTLILLLLASVGALPWIAGVGVGLGQCMTLLKPHPHLLHKWKPCESFLLTVPGFEIENYQGWGSTTDFEVDNTNLSTGVFWSCSFRSWGLFRNAELRGLCHVTRVLLSGGWETTGPVTWWGQKTSENQKKAGLRASDWLDWGSFVPEPSTEPGQAMLGNGWASFSPSRHRLPHWKSRREIFLIPSALFCVRGMWHCRRMKGDESSGWESWVALLAFFERYLAREHRAVQNLP